MSVRKRKYNILTISKRIDVQNHHNKDPNQEVVEWVFKTFEGFSEYPHSDD